LTLPHPEAEGSILKAAKAAFFFLSTSGIISGMRALIWVFRLFLFLLLFGFAVKNDDVVVLRFFFGAQWQVPLVLVILLFVTIGVLIGVTATLTTLYRQHREIGHLRDQGAAPPAEGRGKAPIAHGPDLPETY
jgi:putative membrane protein